jgi:hypothetical protein
VAVAGLGDRPLAAALTGGALAGHEPQVGADRALVEALPVADLRGQAEGGQACLREARHRHSGIPPPLPYDGAMRACAGPAFAGTVRRLSARFTTPTSGRLHLAMGVPR